MIIYGLKILEDMELWGVNHTKDSIVAVGKSQEGMENLLPIPKEHPMFRKFKVIKMEAKEVE